MGLRHGFPSERVGNLCGPARGWRRGLASHAAELPSILTVVMRPCRQRCRWLRWPDAGTQIPSSKPVPEPVILGV
ncbi:hypothetical protein APV28_4056 [Comamonas testosteroni]|nr:hypothetical protein APV28_4056 [Comamonas testosteroni]